MPSTTSATDSLESTLTWAGEGFEQSWALYAVPDGLIAATSVQRNGEGPPDVVVTRAGGWVFPGVGTRSLPPELPSCRGVATDVVRWPARGTPGDR